MEVGAQGLALAYCCPPPSHILPYCHLHWQSSAGNWWRQPRSAIETTGPAQHCTVPRHNRHLGNVRALAVEFLAKWCSKCSVKLFPYKALFVVGSYNNSGRAPNLLASCEFIPLEITLIKQLPLIL